MKVIISAHMDLAEKVMAIKMDDKTLLGLVDNFAGVFAAYQASRKTGVEVYFTNFEELPTFDGADAIAPKLDKDALIIVVDTTIDAEDKDAYIGNAYGIDAELLKPQFKDRVLFKDGFWEPTEDETFIYGKKHSFKTLYFGIPIPPGITHKYHDVNNKVSLEVIDKAALVLIDLINWFKEK
ncbi:MAG TPA: hypothetical protein VGT05_01125 [Patescibacteria group bacterium]|nr:hypothetical protein [Patescibacteria group bacterium]